MNPAFPGVGPDRPHEGRTVAWNGCVLSIVMDIRRPASHTYVVTLVSGLWPGNDDLIALCDRTIPPARSPFGGVVKSWADGRKFVTVYVD